MSQRTDSIRNLLPALLAAREAFLKLLKDNVNPYFSTDGRIARYADLAAVLEACEPSLRKNGLGVIQTTFLADGTLTLLTTLAHTSGEWISSEYPIARDFNKPQTVGAAMTYGRRYSYMSIVGIAPEDDDGETASGRGANSHATRPTPPPPPRPSKNGHNGHAANGNGHAKPKDVWGGPGNASAAAVAAPPKPKASPPPQAPAQSTDTPRTPASGSSLGRWVTEIEQANGPGMLTHMLQRARGLGWPMKWAQWTAEQVDEAYRDALEVMEVVYDPYAQVDEQDGDADRRYDNSGH
jgi:hypothetical protein